MTTRLNRKRPDQLRSYAGKRRTVTLTERAILADGFNFSHGVWVARTVAEIAERCQISVHALMPHLRSLLAKGEIEPLSANDVRYRRTGGAV